MSDDERIYRCPQCNTVGYAIHEINDKSKILYSDGIQTVYAKKMQCANCGAEWSKEGLFLNGLIKKPQLSSEDIVFTFISNIKENHKEKFEIFSDDDWKQAARYFLTKYGIVENDSLDANYTRYAEFMDFIESEAKKQAESQE